MYFKKSFVSFSLTFVLLSACGFSGLNSGMVSVSDEEDEDEDGDELGLSISGGVITYESDRFGNTIPDFSYVGYMQGDVPIPDVAVSATVEPGEGDDTARIQAAINQVSALPLTNGFRGAVLLRKGNYEVAGKLQISASGVVLRGEGSGNEGTHIVATGKEKRDLIEVSGSGNLTPVPGASAQVSESYVPFGQRSIQLNSAAPFAVGDKVVVRWSNNQKWISKIGMDNIKGGSDTKQWQPFSMDFERTVKAVCGNTIVVDAPLVQSMDAEYSTATVFKYTFDGRISNVGFENLRLSSEFRAGQENSDEEHAWTAISVNKAEHGWVRNVHAYHFAYSAVYLKDDAKNFTVRDSKNIDPVSIIDGGRRYSFNNNGSFNFFARNETRNGRHDFVTGSGVPGPNVFYKSKATRTHSDVGPHHRWAVGSLYDNIEAGDINVQDRGDMGTGHGWSGAQQVFWNNSGDSMICENPPTAKNFSFGFRGSKKSGRFGGSRDSCQWESHNKRMDVDSLYDYQLNLRQRMAAQLYTCQMAEQEIASRPTVIKPTSTAATSSVVAAENSKDGKKDGAKKSGKKKSKVTKKKSGDGKAKASGGSGKKSKKKSDKKKDKK